MLSYQTKHYVKILVNPNLNNPTDNICAVINEKEIQNFDAEYGATSLSAYANVEDDDETDNLLPIREGQQIWFNVEGNISVAEGGFNGWVPIRYRRHKLTAKKLKLRNHFNLYLIYFGLLQTDRICLLLESFMRNIKSVSSTSTETIRQNRIEVHFVS